jgi:hypothetical protein
MKGTRGRREDRLALQRTWRWVFMRDPSIKSRRERKALNTAARRRKVQP